MVYICKILQIFTRRKHPYTPSDKGITGIHVDINANEVVQTETIIYVYLFTIKYTTQCFQIFKLRIVKRSLLDRLLINGTVGASQLTVLFYFLQFLEELRHVLVLYFSVAL